MIAEKVGHYTEKQFDNAKRLIKILKNIPVEKQLFFTAIVIAYIDGLENGMRIDSGIN